MVSAISGIVVPQTGILIDALDALCAGDRDFVRVLDGVGATAWGYPTFELQQEAQQPLPASARRWRSHVTEHAEQHGDGGEEPITYADWTIEKILSGDGSGPCPRYLCYNDSTVVHHRWCTPPTVAWPGRRMSQAFSTGASASRRNSTRASLKLRKGVLLPRTAQSRTTCLRRACEPLSHARSRLDIISPCLSLGDLPRCLWQLEPGLRRHFGLPGVLP